MIPITGQITRGVKVANQTEDNLIVGLTPSGLPALQGGRLAVSNIPIGSVAYASVGTNTTDIAGQLWITDILVPYNRIITKIGFLQGGTATTDHVMVAIYSSQGLLLATSAVAGVVLSGANTFQEQTLALDGNGKAITQLQLYGPAQYYIAVQGNGTTAGSIQTVPTATFIGLCAGVISGTFGTMPSSITVPTTFTAGSGPVVYLK